MLDVTGPSPTPARPRIVWRARLLLMAATGKGVHPQDALRWAPDATVEDLEDLADLWHEGASAAAWSMARALAGEDEGGQQAR